MNRFLLALIILLLPGVCRADYILKGPHTTVETDGTQADGSVNLITKNAGPIRFYTNNVERGSISATGLFRFLLAPQIANNTWLNWIAGDGTSTLNVLKADATNNTILNSNSGTTLMLQVGEVSFIDFDTSATRFYLAGDSQRLLRFIGASDTSLRFLFGDDGTTAEQGLIVRPNTSDADDDASIILSSGGDALASRGAVFEVKGNERLSGGGSATIYGGAVSTGNIDMNIGHASASFRIADASSTPIVAVDNTGVMAFPGTGDGVRMAVYVPTMAATPVAVTNEYQGRISVIPTAAANTAAFLPASPGAGDIYKIINSGPNTVRVKAGSGDTINGGSADMYIPLATMVQADCVAASASAWHCQTTAGVPTPAGP